MRFVFVSICLVQVKLYNMFGHWLVKQSELIIMSLLLNGDNFGGVDGGSCWIYLVIIIIIVQLSRA